MQIIVKAWHESGEGLVDVKYEAPKLHLYMGEDEISVLESGPSTVLGQFPNEGSCSWEKVELIRDPAVLENARKYGVPGVD